MSQGGPERARSSLISTEEHPYGTDTGQGSSYHLWEGTGNRHQTPSRVFHVVCTYIISEV